MTDSKQEKHSEIHRILSRLLPTEEGRKIVADSLVDVFNLNIGWRCLWRRVLSRDDNWVPVEAPVQSNSVFSVTEDRDTVFIRQVVEELIRPVDAELIRRLSLGVEWVDYSQGDIPKLFEDYREYTDTHEGVVIMNAPTYAWVRKWGREHLEVITERKVLLTGQMATFGRMNLFVSRLVLDGQVFFAPKGVGRYTEALTFNFHEGVSEASPFTQWKASLDTHLEVGTEVQVRGVRLDMGTKPESEHLDRSQEIIQIVETNLQRELKHLGYRLICGQFGVAKAVYANIMDTRLPTSTEIRRIQVAATEKMTSVGLE